MAAIPSTSTQVSSIRTFYPFPRLPAELRLKIWGLRYAESPQIVDFVIDSSSGNGTFLTFYNDSKLHFRACKQEREECLRLFKLEEDVRNSLGPVELKEPHRDPTEYGPNFDKSKAAIYLKDSQFRYSRDIARFKDVAHMRCLRPIQFPTSYVLVSNLRHVILNEFIAEKFNHRFGRPLLPLLGLWSELPRIIALESFTILNLSHEQVFHGPLEPLSNDGIERVIQLMKILFRKEWPQGLDYNVPWVTVLSYSNEPIYGPEINPYSDQTIRNPQRHLPLILRDGFFSK